jgi:hypothetical protein
MQERILLPVSSGPGARPGVHSEGVIEMMVKGLIAREELERLALTTNGSAALQALLQDLRQLR